MEDFRKYVERVVKKYRSDIDYWEVWNEPDLLQCGGRVIPKQFVKIIELSHKTIKKYDPTSKVVLGGLAGQYSNFLETILPLGAGAYFDIYADHSYGSCQYLRDRSNRVRELFKKYDVGQKIIWNNEDGLHTRKGEADLKEQAEYLVKKAVTTLSEGGEKFFWYQLGCNRGVRTLEEGMEADQMSGVIWGVPEPKPAAAAYANLTQLHGKSPNSHGFLALPKM